MKPLAHDRFRLLLDYRSLPPEGLPAGVADAPVRQGGDVARCYVACRDAGIIPQDREAFAVLLLNARHRVLAFHVVSVGTLNSCPVGPREVFRPAIAVGAHAVVVAHHHPSGDPTPSADDARVTHRLTDAGDLLGIAVLDHVVVGSTRFWSITDGRSYQLPDG